MNIFFYSRIYANPSLPNVLFGQQQKATSSQNTGCRGTIQTDLECIYTEVLYVNEYQRIRQYL